MEPEKPHAQTVNEVIFAEGAAEYWAPIRRVGPSRIGYLPRTLLHDYLRAASYGKLGDLSGARDVAKREARNVRIVGLPIARIAAQEG